MYEYPLSRKLLLPLWSKSLCSELREDEASETYYDNVQLLQTQNLTGYRTPNDDIQTRLGSVKEIQIIHRLFLVTAMYCQASSSHINQSTGA